MHTHVYVHVHICRQIYKSIWLHMLYMHILLHVVRLYKNHLHICRHICVRVLYTYMHMYICNCNYRMKKRNAYTCMRNNACIKKKKYISICTCVYMHPHMYVHKTISGLCANPRSSFWYLADERLARKQEEALRLRPEFLLRS